MSKPPLVRPKTLQARISRLINHWPPDPVRPAAVSVQNYLQNRLPPSDAQSQQKQQQQQEGGKPAQISEASVNALFSLLEDRYARRYPLPQKLRHPASDPDHFDNVVREFEEAPRRNWIGRLKKRVTGLFRFK
ncbi:hypothetical protein VTN00DRAFT_5655 [Thermoascus crustaceus]|uniref:uncharacterized protein n=1 Tax=Thermoascus crustaceus TaxID=5088 RepID=UPI0037429857